MRTFNKSFKADKTHVQIEGLTGWHLVTSINDTRIIITIARYMGSFQRGHVEHFTNR